MGKNIAYQRDGNIVVLAIRQSPSDEEWDAYIDFLKIHMKMAWSLRILVYAGAGPSAPQRKKLNDVTTSYPGKARIAVVTSSALVRSAVQAARWFDSRYQAFAPQDIDTALVWLELPSSRFVDVKRTVSALQVSLASKNP